MRGFSRPMIFASPPKPELPIKKFEALVDFRSDETESVYAKGQQYMVWPDQQLLGLLVKRWEAEGKIKAISRHITTEYIRYVEARKPPKPTVKERLRGAVYRLRRRLMRALPL